LETIAIVIAFVLGFIVMQVGLPPLVGFLVAGFFLHAFDIQAGIGLVDHVPQQIQKQSFGVEDATK